MTAETNRAEDGQGSPLNGQQEDAKDREAQSDESTAELANGFASKEHSHSDVESATLERVVVYSRGSEGQHWQNFDEATLASTVPGEPTAAAQSIEAAINHEPILGEETVSLIAAEENANEELMKGEEIMVENVDLINQANGENNAADLGSLVEDDASGVKASTLIQTNGETGDGEMVLGEITSSDLEKEATWTKPTDNVIKLSTEKKESDISKTFKSIPATDADFLRNTNMKPENGEMMQVVYGRDPLLDKEATPDKRVWSAKNSDEMPDPQLDWEGRDKSGKILNEPIENKAELTPMEDQTEEIKGENMKRLINGEGKLKTA